MMKTKYYILLSIFCILPTILSAQIFKGRVTDINHRPLAYANIILQEQVDSTFITGCITDANGYFYIENNERHTRLKKLRISLIGYKTKTIDVESHYNGIIILEEEAQVLQEVTIKGHKPIYQTRDGILNCQIKGSILSNIGTASDVLKQLPFITTKKNTIEVFGKGKPLIYINNRQIRTKHELEQLKSEQIKDIELIMNPGSQYDSEANAVIKITTLRPISNGIGGSLSLEGIQKNEMTYNSLLDLTYKSGKWDVFVMTYYDKEKWNQEQNDKTSFQHKTASYKVKNEGGIMFQYKLLELSAGFNYTINEHKSFGAKYIYSKDFPVPASVICSNQLYKENDYSTFHSSNHIQQGGYSHYINTYYRNEFENKNSFNLDGTFVSKENIINTTAWNDIDNTGNTIPTKSSSKSRLYALKAWGEIKAHNESLEIGAEGTRTSNIQNFQMENEAFIEDLPNNQNKSVQNTIAAYISYTKDWGKFTFNGGIRYEYNIFDYFINGIKQDAESKRYHVLSPSLSLSYHKEKLSVSLNYRTTAKKPTYWQLRSNISYNNPFSYEGGNPTLQKTINHHCGILFSYKDFHIECAYSYKEDDIMLYQQHFKEKPVILTSFINHNRQTISANFSYSPIIGIWKPTFAIGLSAQNMHHNGYNYNKPIFSYMWKNIIEFPRQWIVTFNINGSSYGHSQFTAIHSSFYSEVAIKKSIGKSLDIYAGMTDLFNTYREQWSMNVDNILFSKWNNPDYRQFYLRAVVRFNKTKHKYKGGFAGKNERSRL